MNKYTAFLSRVHENQIIITLSILGNVVQTSQNMGKYSMFSCSAQKKWRIVLSIMSRVIQTQIYIILLAAWCLSIMHYCGKCSTKKPEMDSYSIFSHRTAMRSRQERRQKRSSSVNGGACSSTPLKRYCSTHYIGSEHYEKCSSKSPVMD